MTKSYRDKLNEIREQSNAKENQIVDLRKIDRDGLVIDASDTPAEIERNLESNLGPIDTPDEIEAKGINKKKALEDEEILEVEEVLEEEEVLEAERNEYYSSSFKP